MAFAESWASLRAAPPRLGPLLALCQSAAAPACRRAGSSGGAGPGEAAHTHVPQKPLPLPRACRGGRLPGFPPSCFGLSQLQRSGRLWLQPPPRASCTLCRSSWPHDLLPEVTPAAPGPSHPGTLLLFALAASPLCSERSAPRLSLACSPRRTPRHLQPQSHEPNPLAHRCPACLLAR